MTSKLFIFLTAAVLTLSACSTAKPPKEKPVTKAITVSNDSMGEDMLQFTFDDKGLDVAVHFTFDEDENMLTVALVPSRPIFTFQENTEYRKVFKRCFPMFPRKKFHPEKLSYPILLPPSTTTRIRQHTKATWNKPKKKHLFNKWIETSDGLLPVCQQYTLLADSVVQQFKLEENVTKAKIKLRNILALDLVSKPTKTDKKYKFTWEEDLNLTYDISIQRNPCFGTELAQQESLRQFEEICTEYNKFRSTYYSGIVGSMPQLNLFKEYKAYLLSRFPKITEKSACADLQYTYDEFNLYVDSISAMQCRFVPPVVEEETPEGEIKTGIDPVQMIANVRKLDDLINNYLNSKDVIERRDLTIMINNIIRGANLDIRKNGVIDAEQAKAVALFRKAESYYKTITK